MRSSQSYSHAGVRHDDCRRLDRLRALVRATNGGQSAPDALQRAVRRWRRALERIGDPWTKALARQWYCEWRLLHGMALDAWALHWPCDEALRARLLTVLLNTGYCAPFEAWGWLAGVRVCGAHARARWPRVWEEFRRAAECAQRDAGIRHHAPFCWLAGTPGARAGQVTLVEWRTAPISIVFRQAWERNRRTGREDTSRLEDEWYRYVCDAFPGLQPVRHALLVTSGMHVDMYWPQRNVALEVQGAPHWQGIPVFGGVEGLARRQQRDARKRVRCAAAGIRLVEVTPHTPVEELLSRLGGLLGVQPGSGRTMGGRQGE
jgi:hypothetical protein